MSTAVRPRRQSGATGGDGNVPVPADAFVVFGITGNLAKVMTFRSLYRLERRGLLNCPIVVVKLDPSTGIRMVVDAQRVDEVRPERITLDMEFAEEGGEGATPYEVLLHAAMVGDSKRFTRQDAVEETWRVMQPLLDAPPKVHGYQRGSWGPAAADDLVEGHGRWHGPWIES